MLLDRKGESMSHDLNNRVQGQASLGSAKEMMQEITKLRVPEDRRQLL
jgi:hypothetical protein